MRPSSRVLLRWPLERRSRCGSALLVAILLLTVVPLVEGMTTPVGASTGREYVVAPWGSDSGSGSANDPFGTMKHATKVLQPGDTLTARGGTYRENVIHYSGLARGSATNPITVRAYPGERPVIHGRLALYSADHWHISGINVTWWDGNSSNQHMIVFNGGTGFRFSHAEVWGAKSFAAIVTGYGSRDFRLDHLYVHHTYTANDVNQDHLIYVSADSTGGIIEHNVLAHSPNGRGVKLGPGSLSEPGASGNIVRYNTFFANEGPSSVRLSGDSNNNQIYGNIMVRPKSGEAAVTAWSLSGSGNVARDNIAWHANGVVKTTTGLSDGGGNTMVDPVFADPANGDYTPTNPAATDYGAHAGQTTTAPISTEPTGPTGGAPTTTTSTPSSPQPTAIIPAEGDALDAFVRAVVADFLARPASDVEVTTWRGRMASGLSREQVARGFAFSEEWIGVLVDGYYRSTLGRGADGAGRRYWTGLIASGVTPAKVASEFYASAEYFRRSGGTNQRWVADLYRQILHRQADAPGLQFWAGHADRGTPRSLIARDFYQSVESRRDRVESLYEQLLGRTPDPGGARHWVDVLANGRDVDLATFLASSAEYLRRAQRRFG
jgi:hypothetical protein